MANYIKAPSVLLYPLMEIWISADCEDHGYPADDLGWWDYDPSIPEDSGEHPRLYAMANGIVTQIVNSHPDYPDDEGYGNYIVIEYPTLNMWSLFAHIKKNTFMVKVGDLVEQGQPVCRMDNSGYSRGSHLHLEVGYGHFVRHGGVDPTKVVYCTEWHIVDEETQRDYKLLHLTITPEDRDVSKDQVNVFGGDLRIRKAPINGEIVGFASEGYYTYTETVEDEYTWCKVGDYWIAGDTDVSEICVATFVPVERDETREQAEVLINDLRIRQDPSTSSKILGYAPEGFYNIESTYDGEDYVWFQVCGAYIACVDGVNYYPSEEDPKDKKIKELEEQVAFLTKRLEDTEDALHTATLKNIQLSDAVLEIRSICEKVTQE